MIIFNNPSIRAITFLLNSYRTKVIKLLLLFFLSAFTESIGLALIPTALSLLTPNYDREALPAFIQPYLTNFNIREIGIFALLVIFSSFIAKQFLNLVSVGYSRKFCGFLRDEWRSKILDNYFNSETTLIRSQKAGKLIDNLILQPTKASKFIRTLIAAINQLIISLGMLIILLFSSWKLTFIICLIFSFIALIGSFPLKRISTFLGREELLLSQKITSKLTESINGILQIKIFNLEKILHKQIIKSSRKQSSISVRAAILAETPSLFGSIAVVLIVISGIFLTFKDNQPNLALIAMFLIVSQRLNNLVGNLMRNYTNLKNMKPSFDLVLKLIKRQNIFDKSKEKIFSNIKNINSLEMKNICFSYKNKPYILENFNLKMEKGESCFIDGESGSGKSTLINLICGLNKPSGGTFLINELPIERINNKSFLQKISYISQDNYLFNDTIKNNLKTYNSKLSDEDMFRACEKAAIHKFISSLPKGYETIVGERGFSLSGGQIQRIAIARAFLRNGDVMIFDEATSALDKLNQELILKSIQEFSNKGKIIFFISHLPQTKIDFDKKITLELS